MKNLKKAESFIQFIGVMDRWGVKADLIGITCLVMNV